MKVHQHVKCWEHGGILLLHPRDRTEVYEKPEGRASPTCFHTTIAAFRQKDVLCLVSTGSCQLGVWGRERGDIHTLFLSTYLERPKNQLHNSGTRSC